MLYCVDQIVSLILVPILIVVLGFLLILLIVKRNKTDTLARLAYELHTLIKSGKAAAPDEKSIKKLDIAAAKCELLCDRASFEQKQDLGPAPERIAAARRVLHALIAAKVSGTEAEKYIAKAVSDLEAAYSFLIDTLGITAAPLSSSLKFFSKNMRSDNARKYLDSLISETASDEPSEDGEDDSQS